MIMPYWLCPIKIYRMYYCLAFLFAIKLFTKYTIEKAEVPIINKTLTSPKPPWSIDLGSLIPTKAIKMTSVKRTAICATTLFSFLTPGEQRIKAAPKPTGISAVGEITSRYPHNPIEIKQTEFIILAFVAFIVWYFS